MRNKAYNQGLSTIEFFVVIIIMFCLMGCVMVLMAGAVKEANDAERRSHIAQLMRILLTLKINTGTFPVQTEECSIGKDCEVFNKILADNLLDIPTDPRGPGYYYYYQSDGDNFSLKAILGNGTEYVYKTN